MRAFLIVLAAALAGCGARTDLEIAPPAPFDAGPPLPDTGPPPSDTGVPMPPEECVDLRQELVRPQVDVLFVVDDSRSMVEEQEELATSFGSMAFALATGDLDGDGTQDVPAADLHVAVVTSDLGAFDAVEDAEGVAALRPRSCGLSRPGGNDGVFQQTCAGDARFLTYEEGDSVERFAAAFACMARVGTDGCGFEMPLEAALKALTPATSDIRFAALTSGHADGLNAGFLREDSVLAVVVLTDEDDGSVGNASFVEAITRQQQVLGSSWLHPVERYAEGLSALREDPERLVFAAIAGLPGDLEADPAEFDTEATLADDRMRVVFDPEVGSTGRMPSCQAPGLGDADPPRRLVELAGLLGDRAVVRSICEPDYSRALGVVAERVGEAIVRVWCAD